MLTKAWLSSLAAMPVSTAIGLKLQSWGARLWRSPAGRSVASRLLRHGWIADQWRFYQAWRANPKGIGAVLPSSAALATAITREIDPAHGPVIELGSGTGVFTRALRARGIAEEALTLVEMDRAFAQGLRREFPDAHVCCLDAGRLAGEPLSYGSGAGAVVCGLPLLNMPLRQQVGILRGAFAHLRPGGAVYLFTYGLRCPVPQRMLDCLGLRARRLQTVVLNVPPAHVWKITRRGGLRNAL